ncbi:FtsK/SpoIIIE domain-containing protein [Streptomyces sp. TLI_171]|uniref:FtsK/SpoIIIE domain-containing protein n=1 Tax=Streptomyces sp. TLI_171 TaxID=1938859 RepID=UPI000C19FC9A|nr:FtsK/SpoIIIE domain-containing protein [Streptomyces sp. TLI_171]RKE19312.1 S-DNA-T family DNA segregation ATPase FtsK/SpoIIIE [Streptomyces sp. TLI_171]
MQIRLTVLRPRSGPAAPGSSADVLVTAPVGTVLGAVATALAGAVGVRGPRSATHVHLYAGERRLDEQTPLGHPPLIDGAVLALGEPDPDAEAADERPAAELRVVGGPDAGGVHRLHGERIRIGRSTDADVPLDDPDVSRLHLALHLSADGRATVQDLGSTNGTLLDEQYLGEDGSELAPGALLRIGESTLQLAHPDGIAPRATTPDGEGRLRLAPRAGARTAPGRGAGPAPAEPPAAEQPAGRGRWLRRGKAEPAAADTDRQHATARTRQAANQRERWPDPAALLLTALGTGPRLWERGPDHPDALTLRLGTGDLPGGPGTAPGTLLPAVPATVDLQTAGSLGLAGPRHRLAGLARAAVAQLAALHPPSGLALVVVAADRPAEDWAWTQWLPHLRPAHGQACRLLLGLDAEQAEARLTELAAATAGPPATVVLVDGDPGTPAGREALALLVRQGPAAGVFTLCLADSAEELPTGLGAVGVVTGEVATRLTLDRPAGGARERLTDLTLDAVSPAWAERLARTLAPLAEADTEAAPRGPLPDALRLLDLLRSESLSPARLAESWSALPAGAGGAGALLGTARGAAGEETCGVDLAEDGEHLLIGGGPGSGKSELLRSLAASLAVSESPDRLALLMVDGDRAEGGGLAGCTDLPHVTAHVNAAEDPRGALLAAERLNDELAHREALFDGLSFTEWHTRRVFDKTPALVGGPAAEAPAAVRVVEPRRSSDAPSPDAAPPRLVVLVDDFDALLGPASPGGRPLARALAAAARRGARLGVHVVASTGDPEATAGTELDEAAQLRIALRTEQAGDSDLLIHLPDAAALPGGTPGRGYLRRPDGAVTAFQGARVSGRIPRTATLRPTVVAQRPEEHGVAPSPRPVRELGNGPTDLALLASALRRATES